MSSSNTENHFFGSDQFNKIYNEFNSKIPIHDFKNICSCLLVFSPYELVVLSTITAIIISKCLTIEEKTVIGAFLTTVGDNISLIATQEDFIITAKEESKTLYEQQNINFEEEESKFKKDVDEYEKAKLKEEIRDIKLQLLKINKKLSDNKLK